MTDRLENEMSDEFYCGGCGTHKPVGLIVRRTPSGKGVCASCQERMVSREKYLAQDIFNGCTGQHVENKKRKQNAKKYRDGKLPKFMYT